MSFLKITHLSKAFGASKVLNDISFSIDEGSFVTLLGPSGCGKTTLLRIIAGLENGDDGQISTPQQQFFSAGDSAEKRSLEPQKRGLGFVFQDYALWPHMNVRDNVGFPLQMANWKSSEINERVMQVLESVRLAEHADKRPSQLSGGQQQRVSIARALAAQPKLLLLDEPLSNLDANLREELGMEIRALTKSMGLTCINVTHDRREAQMLSDKIALMRDGVIHQLGSPEELFIAPRDRWSAEFLDCGNILTGALIGAPAPAANYLIPRTALTLDPSGRLNAQVTNLTFAGDRYEVTAVAAQQQLRLYSHSALAVNSFVQLSVDMSRAQAITEF